MSYKVNMGSLSNYIGRSKNTWIICVALALAVWAVFGQATAFDFVNYDDNLYTYGHPVVSQGVTWAGVRWAFTQPHADNWHPLTTLSHMLDVELYGMEPGVHHLTNILLHMATAIALFLVLRSMTGALWRSAFVAALFALHPLRAESVAWISERKDVLSGLFFMLTLAAYLHYVRRPFSAWRYGLVALAFALGLMAKPMLVTLPCVLLLLDFWPLDRLELRPGTPLPPTASRLPFRRLLLEKLPLLALAALFGGLTVVVQDEAVMGLEAVPLPWRAGNALCAYATYLRQTLVPTGLALFYPHPGTGLALGKIAGSGALLGAISAVVLLQWRKRPYMVTGWLWFLGMLVPVIGILQVGGQAHADRYTYLPQIGLFLMGTWWISDQLAAFRFRRAALAAVAAVVLAAMGFAARAQVQYWRSSQTLWNRALAQTKANHVAHCNLGIVLAGQGRYEEAMAHYRQAVQAKPRFAEAHFNWGLALATTGQHAAAIGQFRAALAIAPRYAEAHSSLGVALIREGRIDEAIGHFQAALQTRPGFADAHYNLGSAYALQGRFEQAMEHFRRALEIKPGLYEACFSMGDIDVAQGALAGAIAHYGHALEIKPDFLPAMNNLAWLRATAPDPRLRDGAQAIGLAESLVAASGGRDHSHLDTLAAAYAEAGRFAEAAATARRALAEAPPGTDLSKIEERLRLYEAAQAYHANP